MESGVRKVCGRLTKLPVRMREGDIIAREKDMTGHNLGVLQTLGKDYGQTAKLIN